MTDEDQKPTSWTVFRLPRSHWHCDLDGFEWGRVAPASLRSRVEDFLTAVEEGEAPRLFLTGRPGIGKSHLSVAAYRRAVALVGTGLATWINVPDFCDRAKRSYSAGEPDPWEDYEAARRLVVLDDLFGRDLSSHEVGQIVYRLVDVAYRNGAALLVTMNPSIEDLRGRLDPHEVSRLLQGATVIPMEARDYRITGRRE